MLPLIPAILLLLLQGPSNIERFPQDARLPDSWNTLHGSSVRDACSDAALARLLAIAIVQIASPNQEAAAAPVTEERCAPRLHTDFSPRVRLADACQDCRRSRDGPDSNA